MKLKLFLILVIVIGLFIYAQNVYAQTVIDKGINFLKSKQDASGEITQGFGNASWWAAIALAVNGIDAATVKNPSVSLKDFLLSDYPPDTASATDWENRILAIVAMGGDPVNFGGINYLEKLEGFSNNQQLGETYLLNDDIFGLLALIATGDASNQQIKQDVLDFIITHQAVNGGFSWSPDTTCLYCDPSVDMTAAAIQALQAAKDTGLIHSGLDNALIQAKDYLLLNQSLDGGFGYFGSSDADSTSWAVMAFNVTGMGDSTQSANAKNWLTTSQNPDGGFPTWSGSDTTTTSHSLIALSGQAWIFHPTPTPSPDPVLTPTPTPTPISPTPTPTPTALPTPTPTPTPTSLPTPTINSVLKSKPSLKEISETPSLTGQPEVLGETVPNTSSPQVVSNGQCPSCKRDIFLLVLSLLSFAGAFIYWKLKSSK